MASLLPSRLSVAAGRPRATASRVCTAVPQLDRSLPQLQRRSGRVVPRAAEEDFDAVLMKYADKWEKADNKPIIVAYIAGAAFALFTAEWLIHLPALDILLGFPVQLVGLFALPYLGIRYFIDGAKFGDDVDAYTAKIVEKLPGLTKKD